MKIAVQRTLVSLLLLVTVSPLKAQTSEVTHNTWTSGAPMITPRVGAAFGVIKGKVYVVSGATTSAIVTNNEIYDVAKNTWTTGAPIPTARYAVAAAVVENILYVIGGCNSQCAVGGGALTTVEAYDPTTNTWSEKTPMPVAVDSAYAVESKNIIYVVGGYVPGSGRVATLYSFDPATDTWAQETSMNVGKSTPATGVLGGIIAAGGLGNGGVINDNEVYNTTTKKWKTLAAMPTALTGSCFGTILGKFYVASGTDNSGPNAAVQAYTGGSTKSWTTGLASIPQPTVAPASAVVKNQLYCIGGANTGALFASDVYGNVQIYQP
ncbi:MAG: kelch repeat-containing protein [Terriglobales bacterium]